MSPRTLRRVVLYAIAAVLPLGAVPRSATAGSDSIKLGGFWFDRVTLKQIADGQVVYTTPGGTDRAQPLVKVQGLKLAAFPDSAAGQAAVEAGDYEQVLARFTTVAEEARQPWVRHWAQWHCVTALDELERPVEALEAWLQLARDDPDPHFLATPPLKALRAAGAEQKKDLAGRLERDRKKLAQGRAKEPFEQMLAVLLAKPAAETDAPPPTNDTVDAAGQLPAIPISSALDSDDPITQLLQARKLDQARVEAARRLARAEPRLAMRLYQLGLAQLHLAQQSGQRRGYLDAGLSFMRVAIYFRKSRYTGAALIEAGVVHQALGRPDLALKLWDKAQVEIDPEKDPAMAQRLATLRADATPTGAPKGR